MKKLATWNFIKISCKKTQKKNFIFTDVFFALFLVAALSQILFKKSVSLALIYLATRIGLGFYRMMRQEDYYMRTKFPDKVKISEDSKIIDIKNTKNNQIKYISLLNMRPLKYEVSEQPEISFQDCNYLIKAKNDLVYEINLESGEIDIFCARYNSEKCKNPCSDDFLGLSNYLLSLGISKKPLTAFDIFQDFMVALDSEGSLHKFKLQSESMYTSIV